MKLVPVSLSENRFFNLKNVGYATAATLVSAAPAFATTTTSTTSAIDVSGATGLISGGMTTAIASIGGVLITAGASIVAYKWVMAVMF